MTDIDRIKELLPTIPAGPYFVGSDEAEDTNDHKHSGLALVDTGREMDWPIARLCEWPTAEFIALCRNNIAALIEENERLKQSADIYVSGYLPCAKCGELVLREFVVPNDAWNTIIRKNGPETNQEYLCASCFGAEAVGYVYQLQRDIERLKEELKRR